MQVRTTLEVARGKKKHFTIGERKNQMLPIRAESLPGSKLRKTEYLIEVSLFFLANARFADATKAARDAMKIELSRWFTRIYSDKPLPYTPKMMLVKLRSGMHISADTFDKLSKLLDKKQQFTFSQFEDCLNALATMAGLPEPVKVSPPAGRVATTSMDPLEDLIHELKAVFVLVYPQKQIKPDPGSLLLKLRTGCHIDRKLGRSIAGLLTRKARAGHELEDAVLSLSRIRLAKGGAA